MATWNNKVLSIGDFPVHSLKQDIYTHIPRLRNMPKRDLKKCKSWKTGWRAAKCIFCTTHNHCYHKLPTTTDDWTGSVQAWSHRWPTKSGGRTRRTLLLMAERLPVGGGGKVATPSIVYLLLVLHQPAVGSPTLMLTQITLVKRNGAQNRTKLTNLGKGQVGRRRGG